MHKYFFDNLYVNQGKNLSKKYAFCKNATYI